VCARSRGARGRAARAILASKVKPASGVDRVTELQKRASETTGVIGLAGGLPADELLPRAELAAALADVAVTSGEALQYGWPEGVEQLRTWIARRLATRGAEVDAERVIVTAGAQQALSLIGATLGDRAIAVGDATYPAALDAFRAGGARVVGGGGDVAYVVTGVANPQGVDVVDRDGLLADTRALIADEAFAELRFDGRLARPLLADAPERTWHVGTISKTVSPGLRVGWLVPPAAHHERVLELKHAADLQTASVSQAGFAKLLARVDYDDLVARARRHYAERAARLVEALRRHVDGVQFAEPEGGFSIWIETDVNGDDITLLEDAITEGVALDPGSTFRPLPAERVAFRLSYSNAAPAAFDDGARRLARALGRWRARTPRAA